MPRVTVVGSLNADLVTRASRAPDPGETLAAKDFRTFNGGKGANEAVAVRRLAPKDFEVAIVGAVGKDLFGDGALSSLKEEGIDISHVRRVDDVRTGVASIVVDDSSDNRILVYPGANGLVKPENVTNEILEGSDYVLLQNEIPIDTTVDVLERVRKHLPKTRTVYNPSPIAHVDKAVWKNVDILVVNEVEAATLLHEDVIGVEAALDAAAGLVSTLGVGTAIITIGPLGAVWVGADSHGSVPAVHVKKVVDTTCAGDTFLGAMVTKLAVGEGYKEAIEYATKASAIVVTREGAQSSIPKLDEIN